MFLPLLASGLSQLPELDSSLKEAEQQVALAPEIKTPDDLLTIASLRTKIFPFEGARVNINLNALETGAVKAKHFSAGKELEDDFV